jgi:acetylglutamate kinase
MSDVEGVLDNNQKLIPEINSTSIKELIENETITWRHDPQNQQLSRCCK